MQTALDLETTTAFLRRPSLIVTREDMARLFDLVELYAYGDRAESAELLELELERATVVDQKEVPPHVVTMRSRVLYEGAGGKRREAVLVYPHEAQPALSMVSVLAPVGTALIGVSAGDVIDWPLPDGRTTTIRVDAVTYQPEAAGDLHL